MSVTYLGKIYNNRHGGPFDRGSADSYYRRPFRPHYFEGATSMSKEIIPSDGTEEWQEYNAGFNYNESVDDFKDYQ
jgi:hypothetical protein